MTDYRITIAKVQNGYTIEERSMTPYRRECYIADGRWEVLTRVAILLGFGKPKYAVDRVCEWLRGRIGKQ